METSRVPSLLTCSSSSRQSGLRFLLGFANHRERRLIVFGHLAADGPHPAILGLQHQVHADGARRLWSDPDIPPSTPRALLRAPASASTLGCLQRRDHRLQIGFLVEVGLGIQLVFDVGQDLHHARIAHLPLHAPEHLLIFIQRHQEAAQLGAFQTARRLWFPPPGSR